MVEERDEYLENEFDFSKTVKNPYAKDLKEYLKMIDHSIDQINSGETVRVTMEELRGME